uniref:NADH dehydrogenase subunit 6 n=1 Tax=Gordius sp. VVA-2019 TaxID=2586752 RepID=A0A514ABV5_9BILA|nr:NADH dehydrogenase subunit 6 [Gordius sp. VVA-2019]
MLVLALMLLMSAHPLLAGVCLVLLSLAASVMIFFDAPSSLFTWVVWITYAGGVMILYLYVSVLAPSPMPQVNKEDGASKKYKVGVLCASVSLMGVFYMLPPITSISFTSKSNWSDGWEYMKYPYEWYACTEYSYLMLFWCTVLLVYLGYWGWSQNVLAPSPMWSSVQAYHS